MTGFGMPSPLAMWHTSLQGLVYMSRHPWVSAIQATTGCTFKKDPMLCAKLVTKPHNLYGTSPPAQHIDWSVAI